MLFPLPACPPRGRRPISAAGTPTPAAPTGRRSTCRRSPSNPSSGASALEAPAEGISTMSLKNLFAKKKSAEGLVSTTGQLSLGSPEASMDPLAAHDAHAEDSIDTIDNFEGADRAGEAELIS